VCDVGRGQSTMLVLCSALLRCTARYCCVVHCTALHCTSLDCFILAPARFFACRHACTPRDSIVCYLVCSSLVWKQCHGCIMEPTPHPLLFTTAAQRLTHTATSHYPPTIVSHSSHSLTPLLSFSPTRFPIHPCTVFTTTRPLPPPWLLFYHHLTGPNNRSTN
jgi:hypothetical protein